MNRSRILNAIFYKINKKITRDLKTNNNHLRHLQFKDKLQELNY